MFAFFSQFRWVKLGEILMYSHGRGEVEPRARQSLGVS